MIGHLVDRIREIRKLDPAWERDNRHDKHSRAIERQTAQKEYKGDSFDAFCRRQQARLSSRLERAVTRVRQHSDDVAAFESRK